MFEGNRWAGRYNKRNAPEQWRAIGELQKLSESGDCDRYAASSLGEGAAESCLWGSQNQVLLS